MHHDLGVVTLSQRPAVELGTIKAKSKVRRGIGVPLRANPQGRLLTISGQDLADSLINTALGDGENSNPWRQEKTVGQAMIFSPNDPQVRSSILRRLTEVFAAFEVQKRYRLLTDTISWESDASTLSLSFDYQDLEADETKSFSKIYGGE